jgi:hypothetical protein
MAPAAYPKTAAAPPMAAEGNPEAAAIRPQAGKILEKETENHPNKRTSLSRDYVVSPKHFLSSP